MPVLVEGLGEVVHLQKRHCEAIDHARRGSRARGPRQLLRLLVEMTAARVGGADLVVRRLVGAADLLRERAAVDVDACGQVDADRRQEAGDGVELAAVLADPAAGDAAQQADGVRVARVLEDLLGRAFLDELPRVEDADAFARLPDDPEVVADEEDGGGEPLLELSDQVEHLRLHGRVEAGRRLVEDEQLRVRGEGHRDDDALLHPSGELVRVAAQHRFGVGDVDLPQHGERPLTRSLAVDAAERKDLRNLPADTHGGIERAAGVLVDHRHRVAPVAAQRLTPELQHVPAGHLDQTPGHPAVPRQVADDRERGRRLAAARFPHEAVAPLLLDRKRHSAHDLAVLAAYPVHDLHVAHRERGCGGLDECRSAHGPILGL